MKHPRGLIHGIAVLAAGVVYAYFRFAEFRRVVDAAWQGILSATQPVVDFSVARVVPAVQGIIDAIRGFLSVALSIVVAFVEGIHARIEPLMPQIKGDSRDHRRRHHRRPRLDQGRHRDRH